MPIVVTWNLLNLSAAAVSCFRVGIRWIMFGNALCEGRHWQCFSAPPPVCNLPAPRTQIHWSSTVDLNGYTFNCQKQKTCAFTFAQTEMLIKWRQKYMYHPHPKCHVWKWSTHKKGPWNQTVCRFIFGVKSDSVGSCSLCNLQTTVNLLVPRQAPFHSGSSSEVFHSM